MIKCLVSDLDGTLLLHDGDLRQAKIKESTVAGLHELIAQGVHFAIATGRTHSTKHFFDEQLRLNTDFIGSNGASVIIEDQLVINKSLSRDVVDALADAVAKQDVLTNILYVGSNGYHVEDFRFGWPDDLHRDMLEQGTISHYTIGQIEAWFKKHPDAEPLSKVVLVVQDTKDRDQLLINMQPFVEKHAVDMFYSADIFVDIMPGGINKGFGVQAIQDYYGLKKEEIVVVGDAFNDVAMLEQFHKHSFAMATSSKEVQSYAKYVVESVDEVIDYIRKFNENQ